MIKVLITAIAITTLVYLLLELLINYFEVPVLIFKVKQIVAYIISLCFAVSAALSREIRVLMWFFIALTIYWLVKSLIDRSEFESWIQAIEDAVNEQNDGKEEG